MKMLIMAVFFVFCVKSFAQDQSNFHSVPDPKSLNAYKHYWNTFDEYERRRTINQKDSISLAWDRLRQEFRHNQRVLTNKQIEMLKHAAEKYRSHLENFPDAQNTPYVLLNLAQILNMIGGHYAEKDTHGGVQYKSEALEVLDEIIKNYKIFKKKEEVLYLKATILSSLSQKKSAHSTWQTLASMAKNTLYGAHAQIAMGDYYFRLERAQRSLESYQKAMRIIAKLDIDDKDYELVRVQYRIAWAAYRSAELGTCIATVIDILRPGRVLRKVSVKKAMERDAVELIGDALYENNDMLYTKSILGQKILRNYSSAIALRILKRYLAARTDSRTAELGEYVVSTFPRALHIPDILVILADVYRKNDQIDLWLEALEKLALMLPKQSLWRTQYQYQIDSIRNMEQLALHATINLASHYYRVGMTNGNTSSFATASSYYESLLSFAPNHADANDWRLKYANSYFFSNDLAKAQKIYQSIIKDHKVDAKILQIASFQMILTFEKIWREEYGKSLDGKRNPKDDPIVLQFVIDLEEAVDAFANRFPTSQYTVEALLKAGAINRDMDRMERATRYWQRVLVSKPRPLERSLAIRGLVYHQVKDGQYKDLINLVGRYLKLENWRHMGQGLKNELEGILVAAAQDGTDQLTYKGDVISAAYLLIDLTNDFPRLESSDIFKRDAAYLLAIGGEWREALTLSEQCVGQKKYQYKGDMAYLKARALEFQMRFPLAARAYLSHAESYPKHSRAKTSLQRAYQLANAEEDKPTAARALSVLASHSKSQQDKWQNYHRAAIIYMENSDPAKALEIAQRAKKHAKTLDQKITIRLLMAKQRFALGEETKALKEFAAISQSAKRYQEKIDKKTFQRIYSESNFLLASEQKNIFDNFKIVERSGSIANNTVEKMRYFEKLSHKYRKTIQGDDPRFTIRSRYEIAYAAESFAQELNEIALVNESISSSQGIKLQHRADRLMKLSKKLYSENIMEGRRRPKDHYNNPWLRKSAIKLTGFMDQNQWDKDNQTLPYSMTSLMPYQWSLQ